MYIAFIYLYVVSFGIHGLVSHVFTRLSMFSCSFIICVFGCMGVFMLASYDYQYVSFFEVIINSNMNSQIISSEVSVVHKGALMSGCVSYRLCSFCSRWVLLSPLTQCSLWSQNVLCFISLLQVMNTRGGTINLNIISSNG